jgi:hypothetical protein
MRQTFRNMIVGLTGAFALMLGMTFAHAQAYTYRQGPPSTQSYPYWQGPSGYYYNGPPSGYYYGPPSNYERPGYGEMVETPRY